MPMFGCPNDFHEENCSFSSFKKTGYGPTDHLTDGPTDMTSYMEMREDASKNKAQRPMLHHHAMKVSKINELTKIIHSGLARLSLMVPVNTNKCIMKILLHQPTDPLTDRHAQEPYCLKYFTSLVIVWQDSADPICSSGVKSRKVSLVKVWFIY